MTKFKLLLLFTLTYTILIGGDINRTILSGNAKFYSELEKSLDKNQPKDVLDLQKTLIRKLEVLSSKKNRDKNISSITPPIITNQNGYKQAFEKYLTKVIEKDNYNIKLLNNEKSLASLKKQIKKDNNVSLTRQLFYAYYKKRIDFLNSKLTSIDNQLKLYQNSFTNALPKIVFNNEKQYQNIKLYKNGLKKLKEQESIIKLKIEQARLIDNNATIEMLTKRVQDIKNQKRELIHKKLVYDFLIFSKLLQSKEEELFSHENSIYKFIEKHYPNRYEILEDNLNQLFKHMKKKILGFIKTIEGESVEDIKNQLLSIWNFINQPIFNINDTPISIFKLIIAIFIFIIGFFISKTYKHYIRKLASKSKNMSESTQTLLINCQATILYL